MAKKQSYLGKKRKKASAVASTAKKNATEKEAPPKKQAVSEKKAPETVPVVTRLDRDQVTKAVKALLHHNDLRNQARKKKQLIEDSAMLSLIITLFKIPQNGKNKPYTLPLKHSFRQEDETSICIIVNDSECQQGIVSV